MTHSARATELLNGAESLLATRECRAALIQFHVAEAAGAGNDRCAAGRWMCHMMLGQYEQAWRESDAIRGRNGPDAHRFWQGEPMDGKRVMLRCLHGYGDTVMYLRWLPMLQAQASEVIVQAAPEMLPWLNTVTGATHVVTWGRTGESDHEFWDVQIECAELPYVARATLQTLPSPTRCVVSEAEEHRIRKLLGPRSQPRVGLVWTGSSYDSARSLHFDQLRPLLREQGVEFWSLQAPENNVEWHHYTQERGWGARTFYGADGLYAGIADMAAFAAKMDLVITIDTLAAHLAGSLGLPTWLLLKREADWRWMLDRDDTPWYPTTRLFRQRQSGEWDDPLERVRNELRGWCARRNAVAG